VAPVAEVAPPKAPTTRKPVKAGPKKSKPIAATLIGGGVVVVLIVVAVLMVVFAGRSRRESAEAVPTPVAAATPVPTQAPAEPTPEPAEPDGLSQEDAARVAELVFKAREAVQTGNLDAALVHLSDPVLIESREALVLDTARSAILALMESAEREVQRNRRDQAEILLERARNLALRFGFETEEIDLRMARLAHTDSVKKISPNQTTALRSLIGTKVQVNLKDGSVQEGWIRGLTADSLSLEGHVAVGGGYVTMTKTIPLASIDSVQALED
jgi:hypothetical protein